MSANGITYDPTDPYAEQFTSSWSRIRAITAHAPRVQLSTGSATLYTVLADPVEGMSSTLMPEYLVLEGQVLGGITIDLPNRKWLAIKAAHFAPKGKRERVARALAALKRATFSFGLDATTVKAIAEDPDLEYL